MNKHEFLNSLKRQLDGLKEEDKKDILYDYEEHFRMGLEDGRSEDEIAKGLGNPRALAKEIKANYMINKAEENVSASNIFKALIATMALGFFNLVFILGPFIGLAGAVFGIFIAGVGITGAGLFTFVTGIVNLTTPIFSFNPNPTLTIFVSIALTSFGLIWIYATSFIVKGFYSLTIKYLKFNLNIITNRRNKYE